MVSLSDLQSDDLRVGSLRLGWPFHYCVDSLDKKAFLYSLSSPRCINGYWQHTAGGNPVID